MTDAILTITQLTSSIKSMLEGSFPFVWIRGEVSNLSRPLSGHVYFSLKDQYSTISAVWFKGQQKQEEHFDPLTGEVYEDGSKPCFSEVMRNGQEVICAGKVTIYPPRGNYQIVVELAQDAGQGKLQQEFERLKKKLAQQGYFSQERKRKLPRNPTRVAVVTALTGAAIFDFLRMAEDRGIAGEIRIYPVLVQGNEAPAQIAGTLKRISEVGWAEAIALIRGGGSLEDLWTFNTEPVAEAIFTSAIPVVCGVGHEVDTSVADLVADVRAATPTHAAQVLWMERRELLQAMDEAELMLARAWQRMLLCRQEQVDAMCRTLALLSPKKNLHRWEERLAIARMQLFQAISRAVERKLQTLAQLQTQLAHRAQTQLMQTEQRHASLELRLAAMNPYSPLQRGYALARKSNGTFLHSRHDACDGDLLDLVFHDGELPVAVQGTQPKDI